MTEKKGEPAAEAGDYWKTEASRCMAGWTRADRELVALRAQLADAESRADIAELHERELRGISDDYVKARDRLAALEPLCRAAVEYTTAHRGDKDASLASYALKDAAFAWHDTDHGREFVKGMKRDG